MKKVFIIGCGFAGISAANYLARFKELRVAVIDKSPVFNFLPLLPDIIGRGLDPLSLVYPVKDLSRRLGFDFIQAEVNSLDLEARRISTQTASFTYDYLILASGTETNFYGNNALKSSALKLDDAQDGARIRDTAGSGKCENYIVVGGGYTGVEIATNLRLSLNKNSRSGRIIIVERAPGILGPLPQWMKDYAGDNLKKMDIEILAGAVVGEFSGGRAVISGGSVVENSALIWAAGVKTPDFIQNLGVPKNPQGRINVDAQLQFFPGCFAAGDSAYVSSPQGFLRMAVQFAITQGATAAFNVAAGARGKRPLDYRPLDLGYVIPMANNRSCGNVMGVDLKGFLPTCLHYAMCLYRSLGAGNRIRVLKKLLTK
jgi:NADH:ubiquinone reductase (H+-translocating)